MNNKYHLPKDVYYKTIWTIRGYDRLKQERITILYGGHAPADGMPRGNQVSKTTEEKGTRLADISREMEAIEQAMVSCECYADIMNNILYGIPFPVDKGNSDRTWGRIKSRFVWTVAKNLNWI